jgi:hypothetical protein
MFFGMMLPSTNCVVLSIRVLGGSHGRRFLVFWLFLSLGWSELDRSLLGADAFTAKDALTSITASTLVRLPLRCIEQEYPNKLDHVMNNAGEVSSPKTLHPAFYGCLDWHSSVHGHWMLVQLLRRFPDLPETGQVRAVLDRSFTPENIRAEVDYLDQPNRKSFERTYGWAWLLKLAEALHSSNDPDARRWAKNLEPLAQAIVKRYQDFLPRQTYPIRTGVHPNTAFGIAFALDYARAAGLKDLERLLVERARFYFEDDRDYPAVWEPGGEDFFSPALIEADLMRRALPPGQFPKWFGRFLPHLSRQAQLLKPALVTDRTDPKLVHLDGLNLSRAWCMLGIAEALPMGSADRRLLLGSAQAHLQATLPQVASGNYEGEHWLATFAVYALCQSQP